MAEPATTQRLAAEPALPAGDTPIAPGTVLRVRGPRALVRLQIPRRMIPDAGAMRVGSTILPSTPGRCTIGDPAALWLAPDGWLLVSESRDGASLVTEIRRDCGEPSVAAIDVSDSLVVLELDGPRTRELLARGTSVELADETLVHGRCTRLRFAQLPVILRPRDAGRVELIVDRGPAAWLRDWFIHTGSLL
ncbi:MAG: hypothetical protein FGM43_00210 [Sinobacteraceae bacterium]|nr:hypothetical protein [Nevskiaceae bacterium]